MKTLVLAAEGSQSLNHAIKVLRGGGLVAFPTDTVYGLGALAFDENAVQGLYLAKDRPAEKAIPVLIGNLVDFSLVGAAVPEMAWRLAKRFWPGPLTIVVEKHLRLPAAISATTTVGVRQPNQATALGLLGAAGPLAVTSANISGQPDPSTAAEVLSQLGGRIEVILDGGRTPGGMPSTVVDCTRSEPAILRRGPLSLEDLMAELS